MGRDAGTGTIDFDGRELRTGTDRSMDPEFFDELESAMADIERRYHARRVSPTMNPSHGRLLTVHPSGDASIADGPDEGVVDHTGQMFDSPGL
jgi:cholesterol oxidase